MIKFELYSTDLKDFLPKIVEIFIKLTEIKGETQISRAKTQVYDTTKNVVCLKSVEKKPRTPSKAELDRIFVMNHIHPEIKVTNST